MKKAASIILAFVLTASCSGGDAPAPAKDAAPNAESDDIDAEINLDLWLERLEVGSRELFSAREAVVEAVGLEEGDWVGDIGAGTGLYSLLFAEEVGDDGRIFAEDIEPLFLDLITRRTHDAGVKNVTAVLGRTDDVTLPGNSVDVMFIADTYHYFDDRETIMRTIYEALKPGGLLVLVEYEISPGEDRPDYKSHVRFGKTGVISEIEYIGFEFVDEPEVEGLTENYLVRFRKPETVGADNSGAE
ncbi:MAG: class I SAM-dependent methyltransferase [Marinicaulis sp.]|nr:class I SAM-dependent methyltransferase [Marinicaulis sp.]NNE40482.1 class I SAM-dependent methyltransferase [Marinicaulis sp.]NNL89562.1 class I SAM-dependent methyltransferase [Marinicaulis sp.]